MSFVNARPEALAAAAEKLEAAGSALAAMNAAAAAPITGVAPAGADEVSVLQAAQFSAYGRLYESIAEHAHAVHHLLAQALTSGAGAYGDTEAANTGTAGAGLSSAGTATPGTDPWTWFTSMLGGTGPGGLSGNISNIENIGVMNWASAASNLLGMAGGGLLDLPKEAGAGLAGAEVVRADAIVPPAVTAAATAPAAASATPPPVPTAAPAPGWAAEATAAGRSAPVLTVAAEASAVESAAATPELLPTGRGSSGGAAGGRLPRYGVKPTVLPATGSVR